MRARDRILTPTGALRVGPSLLLSVAGVALAFFFTIAYVHQVDERRAQSAAAAKVAQQHQAEQTKAAVCAMILANVRVYEETPPTSPAGKNLAESWAQLSTQFGC